MRGPHKHRWSGWFTVTETYRASSYVRAMDKQKTYSPVGRIALRFCLFCGKCKATQQEYGRDWPPPVSRETEG